MRLRSTHALGWVLWLVLATLPLTARATQSFEGDREEQQLLALLRRDKYIRARQQAERLLRHRPDSVIARYALAYVYHREEGNLPLALYHARLAERALPGLATRQVERESNRSELLVRHWHRRILLLQEVILGEMDRREEQLAVLERYDQLYTPSQNLRRIWPLMKLHRFEEAKQIAEKATLSEELETRISGYNGLLSIEFERERPEACFEAAMRGVRATGGQSCILNLNGAEAAFAVFKFGEAERLALKSIQAPLKDCPDTAHQHLAQLYLLRADFGRAIDAIKQARDRPVPRRLRQQFEMVMTSWLARLLYTLGKFERSDDLLGRVLRAPDRVGLVSFSSELIETIYRLDRYATLAARLERARERASARSYFAALKVWGQAQRLALQAWVARRRAAALVAQHELVGSLLRPYIKPLPPWQAPILAQVAGLSVVETTLEALQRREGRREGAQPYHIALMGQISYQRGDLSSALQLGKRALERLPQDEALLRARTAAWVADAAYRLGNAPLAQRHYDDVLQRWPTALRLLGLRLPVAVRSGTGEVASAVGERLLDSRRLERDTRGLGFVVDVERRGRRVEVCLGGPRGRRYACADQSARLEADEDAEDRVVRIVDAFHETVFAPLIDLTQQDINSLDGSAVRARADEVLEKVFGK
jgi:tetratricopeptide (TPR) repeat protein